MQTAIRRGMVVVGGIAGTLVGWALGAVLAPDLVDITATAGAFLGVVVAGIALSMRSETFEREHERAREP